MVTFVSYKIVIFTSGTPCLMLSRCCSPPCLTSSAHSTRTSNPRPSLFLSHGDEHCDDPQHVATFGPLAEPQLLTGYEPNGLTEMNNTEVTPMFFHRPSMTSTYDSAESIATSPPESDLDDEQSRDMLTSPVNLKEREASAYRSSVYHSYRENSVSSSSHFRENCRETCRSVLTRKKVESRNTFRQLLHFLRSTNSSVKRESLFRFSDPEEASLAHRDNEALPRLSESENAARLALEEQRYHPLAEAKYEVLKQECRADFLDCSLRELQGQIHSSRGD